MEKIDISIFCITYNHVDYIRQALDGFFMQKGDFSYEVLVHDDASVDGTVEILQEYAREYPDKMKLYLEEENQYSQGNTKILYQYLYPHAQGKYFCVCEGDDAWIYDHKLYEQFQYMETHPEASMCVHNALRVDADSGERVPQVRGVVSRNLTKEEVFTNPFGLIPTASFFFRRECMDTIPSSYFKSPVGDNPLRFHCADLGEFYYMDEIWSVRNYMHKGSWNSAMKDIGRHQELCMRYNTYLNLYDEETGGKYHLWIKKVQKEFLIRELQDFASQRLSKVEYADIMARAENVYKMDENLLKSIRQEIFPEHIFFADDFLQFVELAKEKGCFLYGAGYVGKRTSQYLKLLYPEIVIKGFVVSKKKQKENIEGIALYSIDDLLKNKKDVSLLITVMPELQREISDVLHQNQILEFFCLSRKMIRVIEEVVQKEQKKLGEYYCNICKTNIIEFHQAGIEEEIFRKHYIIGGGYRKHARCPICDALDRERFLYYVMNRFTSISYGKIRVLHFAPENSVARMAQDNVYCDYYSADYEYGRAVHQIDVTDIPFKDNRFDYVIINHVLEHIKDEKKALSELKRVLKPTGKLYLSFPICMDQETTEEMEELLPEDRLAQFGQKDHVRLYGTDYKERIERAGFRVKVLRPYELLGDEKIRQWGLIRDDVILECFI